MQLLARNDGMIADSWFSVSKCNLRLGPQNAKGESANSIERAVRKLELLNVVEDTVTSQRGRGPS